MMMMVGRQTGRQAGNSGRMAEEATRRDNEISVMLKSFHSSKLRECLPKDYIVHLTKYSLSAKRTLLAQRKRAEKKSVEKFSLCKGGVCVASLFPTETCKPERTLQIGRGMTNKNSFKVSCE